MLPGPATCACARWFLLRTQLKDQHRRQNQMDAGMNIDERPPLQDK